MRWNSLSLSLSTEHLHTRVGKSAQETNSGNEKRPCGTKEQQQHRHRGLNPTKINAFGSIK